MTEQLKNLLPYLQEQFEKGQIVRIKPGGNSMLPMLHPNRDVVELSALPGELRKYDLPLYRRADGSFVLHRIVEAGDTYTCLGDNQYRTEFGIQREQMVALVTAFVRNGRRYTVQDPRYRMYCRIWPALRSVKHVIKQPKYYLRRVLLWMISKP